MIDHRIAMMGQQPNVLNALSQGTQAAGQVAALRRQAEGQNLFRQHGAGIMAGDQSAMNALAGFDPTMAMDMKQSQQRLTIGEAQLAQIKQQTKLAARAAAQQIDAAQAASEAAKLEAGLKQALPLVMQARETGDVRPLNMALAGMGLPLVEDVNGALSAIVQYEGAWEALKEVSEMQTPPAPADEYGRYVQEQQAKGEPVLSRIEYAQAKKGNDNGISMTMPDGTRVQVGGGQPEGGGVDPSGPGYMLDTVNSILSDQALDNSTGLLSWTQAVPGTPMYRFGTRVKQLEGQAFLQAFESLKGGGQITEIEGQKATQAIGRIDSGMRPEDFRDAMKELQTILGRALERPRGWADTSAGKISTMSAEEIGALDLGGLTPEERAAARQRLKDLIDG